ncbi:type VI secretion system-associated protein TagF [Aestuariibius insulae]|uniref:type VI secretion system-associated protein TagF n=1 Tax=Aestuariibius insulae TaxID=2058287 RepID=UPI00345EAF7B
MPGLYGKHPLFGDFISLGLGDRSQATIETWLDEILPRSKSTEGEGWQTMFDNGLPLRFWAGSDIFAQGPVCGVLRPSRDKVGRRFPLVAVLEKTVPMPPVIDPNQHIYEALAAGLDGITSDAPLAALTDAIGQMDDYATSSAAEPDFWAVNGEAPLEELLSAVSATDHLRATRGRSYWWSLGDATRAPAIRACRGRPDATSLNWLLAGVLRDEVLV